MNKKIKISVVLLIIAAVSFIGYIQIFGLSFEGKESDYYAPAVTGEDNISAYKNSCTKLNLSQVSKDPFSLIDKNVKVTGEILEKKEYVQFDKTRTSIVLKVPGLSPDPYILVSYSGTLTFTQGDMITVYGKYYYPGGTDAPPEIANKFFPCIKAGYIEKK
ncbi:MAG: hypothetical protein FJ150_04850 [Euryarchaeota archaeon]|nr:hypothetical protein [Euryarchaeota archaeon]